MKVALVSPPFLGHLNVILYAFEELTKHPQVKEVHLFVLSFESFKLENVCDKISISVENENVTELVANTPMDEIASVFNQKRAVCLEDLLHTTLYSYEPDLIIYDFFCIEAGHVALKIGTPAICSIPAVLKKDEVNTCSDAFLEKEHLYWIWHYPHETALTNTQFLGPRQTNNLGYEPVNRKGRQTLIYISFGTVVPRYEGCRDRLNKLMSDIKQFASFRNDIFFLFANLMDFGGDFDKLENCLFVPYADQISLLTFEKPDCFIFHGGGNSYSEACQTKVKCIVCPFFGDQTQTANILSPDGVCVYDPKENFDFEKLFANARCPPVCQFDQTLAKMLSDDFSTFFKKGDLVFGHSRHRRKLQQQFPKIDLHLEKFTSFEKFANILDGDLPAIADVYNDETLQTFEDMEKRGLLQTEYGRRLSDVMALKLKLSSFSKMDTFQLFDKRSKESNEEYHLVYWCLDILLLTIFKWNGKIHFLLDDIEEMGEATKIELEFVLKHWDTFCQFVIFYKHGKRCNAPINHFSNFLIKSNSTFLKKVYADKQNLYCSNKEADRFKQILPLFVEREKDPDSIQHKSKHRKLPIIDLYGSRFAYLSNADLKSCIDLQKRTNDHVCSLTWMKGTIVYYYFKHVEKDAIIEVQFWPFAALTNFHKDTVCRLSSSQVNLHKQQQLVLQKEIDRLCDTDKHIFEIFITETEKFDPTKFNEEFSKVCKQVDVDYENTFVVTASYWQMKFIKQNFTTFSFFVCKK